MLNLNKEKEEYIELLVIFRCKLTAQVLFKFKRNQFSCLLFILEYIGVYGDSDCSF